MEQLVRRGVELVRQLGFRKAFAGFALGNAVLVAVLGWQAIVSHETRRAVRGDVIADARDSREVRIFGGLCNSSDNPVELQGLAIISAPVGSTIAEASLDALDWSAVSDAGDQPVDPVVEEDRPVPGYVLPPRGCPDRVAVLTAYVGVPESAANDPIRLRLHYGTARGPGVFDLDLGSRTVAVSSDG